MEFVSVLIMCFCYKPVYCAGELKNRYILIDFLLWLCCVYFATP